MRDPAAKLVLRQNCACTGKAKLKTGELPLEKKAGPSEVEIGCHDDELPEAMPLHDGKSQGGVLDRVPAIRPLDDLRRRYALRDQISPQIKVMRLLRGIEVLTPAARGQKFSAGMPVIFLHRPQAPLLAERTQNTMFIIQRSKNDDSNGGSIVHRLETKILKPAFPSAHSFLA